MSFNPLFPIEVFEEVIDQASDNTDTLRNLSLTCRTFIYRSRYYLFTSIGIRTVQQMESFHQFLDSHPWVPLLVQKVTLSIIVPRHQPNLNLRLLEVIPVRLVTRLPNLRSWRMSQKNFEKVLRPAWLSLHPSALLCYRIYGGCIQHLELCGVSFNNVSDFTKLLPAFTRIHSLTCSHISFRTPLKGNGTSVNGSDLGARRHVRLSQLKTLNVSTSVDIRAFKFLLASYVSYIDPAIIIVSDPAVDEPKLEKFIELLLRCLRRHTHLVSPKLEIREMNPFLSQDPKDVENLTQRIRYAIDFLESIRDEGVLLREANVVFKLDCLSPSPGDSSIDFMEARKSLEDTLRKISRSQPIAYRRDRDRATFPYPSLLQRLNGNHDLVCNLVFSIDTSRPERIMLRITAESFHDRDVSLRDLVL